MRNGMSYSEAGRKGAVKTSLIWKEKHQNNIKIYDENPKKCLLCGKVITYGKRRNSFCSSSCAASLNNRGIVHNIKGGSFHTNGKILSAPKPFCKMCQKQVKLPSSKFCSNSCFVQFRRVEKFRTYELTGMMDSKEDSSVRYFLKCFLLWKKGNKCEICGRTEWYNKKIPLVIDHINGNPEDHTISNIRLVCGNCNMQLPTFSGRNRGNGRAWRRERRKRGLNA